MIIETTGVMYTPSTFLSLLKGDLGLRDLPIPVTDEELLDRIAQSSLREFSIRSPHIETFILTDYYRVDKGMNSNMSYMEYEIPRHIYEGTYIISVVNVAVARPSGYNDYYVPQFSGYGDPTAVLMAASDLKLTAAIAQQMGKALTVHFKKPNKIRIFNGWCSGDYEVEIALGHSINLSTIEQDEFSNFRELALYDLEWFLYDKLKRIDNLDTGTGSLDLKISEWADGQQRFRDLLKYWDEEGANLDIDKMVMF